MAVDRIQTATTLQVRRVRRSWAGLRCFVDDRCPVIGYDVSAKGFFWLAAQGGYGVQTAPAMAKLAASLILDAGVPEDLSRAGIEMRPLSPRRFHDADRHTIQSR